MPPKTIEAVTDNVRPINGAVLLNQPPTGEQEQPAKIDELTVVELLGLAFGRIGGYLTSDASPGQAKREYAIARTAIEDALMRFNRGMALQLDAFEVTDFEAIVMMANAQPAVEAADPTTTNEEAS